MLHSGVQKRQKVVKKIKIKNKDITKISFNLLEEGIKNNDLYSIGKASTFSSLANENIHKKEGLEKIIQIKSGMNFNREQYIINM